MKVTVIGGGFTGCMTALECARQGHEVSLWESADQLGGVLLDIKTEHGVYFNGCQYLRQGSVESLGWPDDFVEFPHEYGGVTALSNKSIRVVDDSAQPSIEGAAQILDSPSIEATALERLKAYGLCATDLVQWAEPFGQLSQLDWRCLIPMQLSRLHFPEDANVPRLKMESHRADQLLATPRRLRGQTAEPAWLPIGGYSQLFIKLEKTLIDLGVDIRLRSPVKPSIATGRLSLQSRTEAIHTDAVIWTANPQPLIKRLFGKVLDTPPIPMKLLVGDVCRGLQWQTSLPYYWQIFDNNSCVVRLYVYELGGVVRFSAETFDTVDNDTAWDDLQRVMHVCGLGDGHQLSSVVKQSRYVNFSPSEFKTFETLTPRMLELGVIPGGWQHYGREEKVRHIASLFHQFSTTFNLAAAHV
jgi:hypothetical protein